MRSSSTKKNDLEKSYNPIIYRGFITILIYTCISIIWILYSDNILESLTKNIQTLSLIQSYKGIGFVIATSIFMVIVMYRYNSLISKLSQGLKVSESKRKELIIDSHKNELYQLLTNYLTGSYQSTNQIVIDIFRYLFKRADASDQGSVFFVGKEFVTYIDVIGYDIDVLNRVQFPADKIELFTFGLNKNQSPEDSIKSHLGIEKYKLYSENTKSIHESIYIGVIDDEQMKFGMSLDISEERYLKTRATYSEEIIKEFNDIQLLMTSMFRIKNMMDTKHVIQSDLVTSFITALECHDEYEKGHSTEVAKIAKGIGRELDLSEEELDKLHWASLVHDIGKLVIPKEILNKPSELNEEEYEIIKEHPINGEMFLKGSTSLKGISKFIRHHHEHFDGKGYPDGLKGEEIPLLVRIITLADAYDSMTSDRPYRGALTHQQALQELINNDGKQFCPLVLEAFLKMNDKLDM